MMGLALETGVTLLLATAMSIAAGLNLVGPDFIREEFRRWHYPAWLRVGVGLTEAAAAILLAVPAARPVGALLALGVLAGVLFTLLRDRAWLRCEYPAVLALLALLLLAR